MDGDTELIALIAGIHFVGLGLACALLWHFMRTPPTDAWHPEDEGGGGGGGNVVPRPPAPVRPRGGGLPLPDALPARVRLRAPARLGDLVPAPGRRPAHEPAPRPRRVPSR